MRRTLLQWIHSKLTPEVSSPPEHTELSWYAELGYWAHHYGMDPVILAINVTCSPIDDSVEFYRLAGKTPREAIELELEFING